MVRKAPLPEESRKMSRLVLVEREFATRMQAESWFHALRRTAWPYVWCAEVPGRCRWKVSALVEEPESARDAQDAIAGVSHRCEEPEERHCG